MKIEFAPRKNYPGRGPCIAMVGDWVTEDVWNVVNRLMHDNYIDSPVYQARSKAHAFFQSGSENSKGKWILLEFWTEQENCADFVKILNEEVNKVINEDFTKIPIVAKSMNAHHLDEFNTIFDMVKDDTKCPVGNDQDRFTHRCREIFVPRSNLEYEAVYNLLEYSFGNFLHRIRQLDKWEIKQHA